MARPRLLGQASITFVAAGLYAFFGGALSLSGWVLDVSRFTDWFNRGVSTQPNTSVLIMLSGAAMLLLSMRYRRTAIVIGIMVAVTGALTLIQHLANINLGFNHQLTFGRTWGQNYRITPGLMGAPASFSLMLIGTAQTFLGMRPSIDAAWLRFVSGMGIVVIVLMMFSLFGYVFDAKSFYAIPKLSAIAPQSVTMLLMLGLGLVIAVPEHEPMRTLSNDSRAAMLARIVLPILVALPLLLGTIRSTGETLGWYDTGTGRALTSIADIVITTGLMWWTLTVLQQREQREQNANNRLASILGSITDGLVTVDKAWRYTLVNEEMVNRVGMAQDEILGKRVWEIFPDATTSERYVQLHRAMTDRVSVDYEFFSHSLQRWFRDKAYPTQDGGLAIYSQDISQQVEVREQIAKSERWLRLLADTMPALISYVDSEGRYKFNNKGYQEWFGFKTDDLLGKHIRGVLGEEAFEAIRINVVAVLAGERRVFEAEIPYRDGGLRFVRAHYVPDVQPDGQIAGYFALIVDISQRKLAEESLLKRNRELSLLAATSQELVIGRRSESEMLQAVFDQALHAMDMEIFFNFIVGDDPNTLLMTAFSGLADDQHEAFSKLRIGDYLCGTVAKRREPVIIEKLQQCDLPQACALRDAGVQCYIGLPLIARSQLLGTIAFATSKRGASSFIGFRLKGVRRTAAVGDDDRRCRYLGFGSGFRHAALVRQPLPPAGI